MRKSGFLLLFLCSTLCQGQNLVPNPSFEIFAQCPTDYIVKPQTDFVPGWTMPTRGTCDYFNACSQHQVGIPQNFMGNCFPMDGKAYTGMIILQEPDVHDKKRIDYREYLQARLTEPLQPNQHYLVSFWYAIASYSTYAVNSLGAYLSVKPVSDRKFSKVLNYHPQLSIDTSTIVTQRDHWFCVSDTFVARGGEQYITLGNFANDFTTFYDPLDISIYSKLLQQQIAENKIAYYYIDMVTVSKTNQNSSTKGQK